MWRNIVETSYAYLKYIGNCRHVELQIQSLSIMLYSVIILVTEGAIYDNYV